MSAARKTRKSNAGLGSPAIDPARENKSELVEFCDFIQSRLEQAESLATDAEVRLSKIPSLSGRENEPDRRGAPRTYTIYRLVRINSDADEGLAHCRNLADTGALLQTAIELHPGETVAITFSDNMTIRGRAVWSRDGQCGIAFDDPIDSGALLREFAHEATAAMPSTLHLTGELPATLRFEGNCWSTMATEVALRSLKLAIGGAFTPGLHVKVLLEDGRERGAVVWSAETDAIALSLLDPFTVGELGSARALLR